MGDEISSVEVYRVHEIFTPTSPARLNYVDRVELEDFLADAVMTPGKQVVVYGETGSGKSSLVNRKLSELYTSWITTRCTASTTFESMVRDAFDKLNVWFSETSVESLPTRRKHKLEANLGFLKAGTETGALASPSVGGRRALEPQITAQRLGETLGEFGACWVIEDFHKVPDDEKVFLSQMLKTFSDLSADYPAVKIIAIGATETAREVVAYDKEMRHRVAELHVPTMTSAELSAIIEHGSRMLNLSFVMIQADIVHYSSGLAGPCHNIALNACLAKRIIVTQDEQVVLTPADLEAALSRYVAEYSDTLRLVFDKALVRHQTKKFDNTRIILTALAELPQDRATHAQILKQIQAMYPDFPAANLTIYLRQLCSEKRGHVLTMGTDKSYRFSEPLYRSFARATLVKPQTSTIFEQVFSKVFSEWDLRVQNILEPVPEGSSHLLLDVDET